MREDEIDLIRDIHALLVKHTGEWSANKVIVIARECGLQKRKTIVLRALKAIVGSSGLRGRSGGNKSGSQPVPNRFPTGSRSGSQPVPDATNAPNHPRNGADPRACAEKELKALDPSFKQKLATKNLRTSLAVARSSNAKSLSLTAPPIAPLKRGATQMRLPDADVEHADAMLAALWQRVEPFVHGMTKTNWRKRYRAVALDMARAGCTIDQVVVAHERASERMGAGVYSVKVVQEQIVRDNARNGSRVVPAGSQYQEFVGDEA